MAVFAIILPWMASYGSERSFLLIFSARDDLVKVSCSEVPKPSYPSYFDQLSERHQLLWRKMIPSSIKCSLPRSALKSFDCFPIFRSTKSTMHSSLTLMIGVALMIMATILPSSSASITSECTISWVSGRKVMSFFKHTTMSSSYLFIGPESDHWQCLSLTHSLTD